VAARRAQVVAAAQAAGLVLNHAAIQRVPNTRLAHRLLSAALPHLGAKALYALMDAVFAAYFVHGQDLGDAAVLAQLAHEHGVPEAALHAWRQDTAALDPHDSMGGSGAHGVPFVVFNERQAVSGAQAPSVWLSVMRQVLNLPAPA
jgi:predicted DsbA family dithiol-disulfide isomerase